MTHLVYCDNVGKKGERPIDKILAGIKTMVVRGAAGRKIPHSRVFEGEELYFMEKGTKLTDAEIDDVLSSNQSKLDLSDKQIVRWHKKCLCLVEFDCVEKIVPPLEFEHQGNMDDWLIIDKIEDVVVGSSIPYNYEKSRF